MKSHYYHFVTLKDDSFLYKILTYYFFSRKLVVKIPQYLFGRPYYITYQRIPAFEQRMLAPDTSSVKKQAYQTDFAILCNYYPYKSFKFVNCL